jgi:hypothetical protein
VVEAAVRSCSETRPMTSAICSSLVRDPGLASTGPPDRSHGSALRAPAGLACERGKEAARLSSTRSRLVQGERRGEAGLGRPVAMEACSAGARGRGLRRIGTFGRLACVGRSCAGRSVCPTVERYPEQLAAENERLQRTLRARLAEEEALRRVATLSRANMSRRPCSRSSPRRSGATCRPTPP